MLIPRGRIDRRRMALGAGGLWLAACSGFARPQIEVNLARGPAPEGEGDQARLDTGADPSQRITAPVRINGQGPFDFVVDTGANRTVVSLEIAQALKLPDGGAANVHGVAGVESAPTVLIDTLQADAVVARGLRAPALPRARLGADGLLGVDVLHDRRVLINFVARTLTISGARRVDADVSAFDLRAASTGPQLDLGRRVAVPARYRFGQLIIIGADVSGRSVTAFVDSGSQSTVGNDALRRLTFGKRSDPKPLRYMSPIYSATGQTAEGEVGEMPLLRIGGLTITNLTTVFADLHVFEVWDLMSRPSLMIGMDVLARFNAIELNYARREVGFYLPPTGRGR